MPSHLRNGKDLSFEQSRAAKRAAARDAGRIWQQQQLANLASCSSAPELPLPSAFHSYHKLPNANGPASSIRQSRANNGLSAPGSSIDHPSVLGDQPAAGYTLSPAALEKIRRSGEQQQGSQTQPAIGVLPVVTRPSATPSAQMPLNNHVAPKSHRVMLRSLDEMDRSTCNQVALQDLERSMATVIPAQEEFMTISSILQGQWFLFINAQRRGNMRLMRTALLQAVSTQRTLASMYGTHFMMQVLDGWISREELARLEQSTHLQTRRRQTQVHPAQAQLHQQAPVQQQQPSQEPMTPPPSPTATPPATGPLQGSQIQHPTAQEQHHVQLQPPLQSNHHHYSQHPRQNGSQFNPPYPRNRRLRYRGGCSNPNSSIAPLDQLPPNPQ
ncbi:hypothetical protein PCANC_17995 [Puccinia coronata f. sp. avenae]|uniref:Uncharacterized protein n=1 Tax=Puccinia coronata f. sp. avenae TaxID=200324 RepID=A0A2N5U3B6_9BASI|nr:hypothetical protein PCANC_17995 [Puccinia coronata f. sp. avenae]